jgi:hypothetical protein
VAGFGNVFLGGFGRVCGAVYGDFCASLSKCDGDGCAKPARRSGYERDLILQVELIEYQGKFSFPVRDLLGFAC